MSSLWFCLALNPLLYLLNETPTRFNVRDNRQTLYNISHLMYMGNIKLYAPSRPKLLQMLQTIKDFSEDIQMSFGLYKCRILDINSSSSTETPENQIDAQVGEIQDMEPHEMYRYLGTEQNR